MPANFEDLQAKANALVQQVTATVGVQSSAKAALQGQAELIKAAVEAKIKEDNDIDNAKIGEFNALIDSVTAQLLGSTTDLAAAVPANPGPGTPPPPTPVP